MKEETFVVLVRVRCRVLGKGTSEVRRRADAAQRTSRILSASGWLDHQIEHTYPVADPSPVSCEIPFAPKRFAPDTIRAVIAFARATWLNDGAEGETVHALCDEIEHRLERDPETKDGEKP